MPEKALSKKLFEEPYSFEFFQAVRLLQKLYPEKLTVGTSPTPADEVARFRSRIGLDFPSSEIQEISETDEGRIEMIVNFMGVAGVSGVLPTHYTELVLDRIRHRDTAMWEFLDIFTHRSVSLFYRAWQKYRFPVGYENGKSDFTAFLFDIVGLGTAGMRGRSATDDEALLPYAGQIAQKPHNINALENIISDHFGVTAKVQQFCGQWLELGNDDVSRLGSKNSVLGQSAIVGSRVWSQQSKFRMKIGPLSFAKFQSFLPSGSANKPLHSIVKFFAGLEFDYDVKLVLAAKQVPATILTTRAQRKPMLGWTTFLKSRPFATDDDQVILGGN
ncbi:MAG TPA: type VI secretion system baseplate subunit TssG [Pyrinomonadaceae bacterium]|nr:type VI secretion system baseplate subunit TssG [Pyrinomonadaceae bacterium]